jgi:hypothetical protein
MVHLDWKRLLSLSPEDLSEEEKDDLYGSLIWYNPEPNIDTNHLKVLFRITQDVLKYKGEQVCNGTTDVKDCNPSSFFHLHEFIIFIQDLRFSQWW